MQAENVNLADIRIVRKLGGTLEESELVNGLVLDNKVTRIYLIPHLQLTFLCSID